MTPAQFSVAGEDRLDEMAELRFALDAGSIGVWRLDLASGEMTTSAACRRTFDRDPDEPFPYEALRAAVHPDDRDRMGAAVARTIQTGCDYDIEYRALTPSGDVRWVHIRAQLTRAPDGAPMRMIDVGTFAPQTLSELGYRTVWATNAEQALAELERDAERFDVVFSDVVMPGMNGIDLAHEIRRRHHDLPVLLASGYSHVLARNGTYGFELLHKPYSVEDLSRLLRKVANLAKPETADGTTAVAVSSVGGSIVRDLLRSRTPEQCRPQAAASSPPASCIEARGASRRQASPVWA